MVAIQGTSALCWEQLCAAPPTKELASIPLLLVLLCMAFDETMEFPTNRAELYQEAIDALLNGGDPGDSRAVLGAAVRVSSGYV